MSKKPITNKQEQVLKYIELYIEKNGYSPAWGTIADHFNTSVSNVRRYINFLIKKGHATRDCSTRPPTIKLLTFLEKDKKNGA